MLCIEDMYGFCISMTSSICHSKIKNKKYHAVGTFPKSNRKTVERGKIDTPNTHIHDL